jgi:hypothetical protein
MVSCSQLSIVVTRLSGPRSRPATSQKIWYRRESNPEPLDLWAGTLTTRPQRRPSLTITTGKMCDVYSSKTLQKVKRTLPECTNSRKAIPLTGSGGPKGCEVWGSMFSRQSAHRWPWGWQHYAPAAPYPRMIPGTHSCYRQSQPQGHRTDGRTTLTETPNQIGNRTRDVPECSIAPQPALLPSAPFEKKTCRKYKHDS